MKVYLDCSPLTNTEVSGIGVYNKSLFTALRAELGDSVLPVLKWSRLRKSEFVQSHLEVAPKALAPILFDKKTVYHATDHKMHTMGFGPKVVTIHDMQPFVDKWLDPCFAAKRRCIMTRAIKSNVDRIIAISQFTKEEILKYFPEVENKIDVVYHGFQVKKQPTLLLNPEQNQIEQIAKGRPFLFFIGNIEERKNLINQIKAFELLKKKYPDLIFILAGKPGFNYDEIRSFVSKHRYKSDLHFTGYLSDSERQYALDKTCCLMFASWYEGFGLPVIEALSVNTNIVVSNTSSLKEIGSGYCHQADPSCPDDIASKVTTVIETGNLKKINLEVWESEWSWKNCASNTIKVYEKALQNYM